MLILRDATEEDVPFIVAHLRNDDRHELEASGQDPQTAIMESLRLSLWAKVGVCDGNIAGIFGLVPVSLLTGIGRPWMLNTIYLDECRSEVLQVSRSMVAEMERDFPRLHNWVWDNHKFAKAWLRYLGFRLGPAVPWKGTNFRPFYKGYP